MLLEVKNLRAGYGPTQVLFGLDFAVAEGGVTALLGANGAGKTTTLRAVSGLIRPEGEVLLAGQRITGLMTESIARLGVAHVPDGRGTFMELTVEENFRLGAYTRRDPDVAADFARMWEWFPRLKQRWRQQAGTLSGGEQQMLAIGRGLMAEPRLLILDEPSLGLSPLLVEEMFALIRKLHAEGLAIMLVEQNVAQSLEIAERAYVLENGSFVLSGPAAQVREDPELKRAYLGL